MDTPTEYLDMKNLIDGRLYKLAGPEIVLGSWNERYSGFDCRVYLDGRWAIRRVSHADAPWAEPDAISAYPLEILEEDLDYGEMTLSAFERYLGELEEKYGLRPM